jgi:hypothetical protein
MIYFQCSSSHTGVIMSHQQEAHAVDTTVMDRIRTRIARDINNVEPAPIEPIGTFVWPSITLGHDDECHCATCR